MATSGTTDFVTTAADIIEDSFREIGVLREDQALAPGDTGFALRKLNRMIKEWQTPDIHLWTKEFATVFLQKGQSSYILSSSSSDHATLNYTKTSLDADYIVGSPQVSFNDNVTVSVNDNIGIVLDSGSLYWDTISNVVNPTTVDLNGSLSGAASANASVYIYTTKLDAPFNVYSAIRTSDDETDVPMFLMSYQEYFDQPNKDSESTSVNWMYDRQRDFSRIYVWPTPADVEYRMQLSIARKIQDLDNVANNIDFPQEWEGALVDNLAVELGPAFGKGNSPNFAKIERRASNKLIQVLSYDSEEGSIKLQPDFHR